MPNRKLEIGHRGWRTTRNAFGLLCILLLGAIGGCASGHRSADSASDKAVECIIREAKDVALKPVDLETIVNSIGDLTGKGHGEQRRLRGPTSPAYGRGCSIDFRRHQSVMGFRQFLLRGLDNVRGASSPSPGTSRECSRSPPDEPAAEARRRSIETTYTRPPPTPSRLTSDCRGGSWPNLSNLRNRNRSPTDRQEVPKTALTKMTLPNLRPPIEDCAV
jgi:hypothetical protein